MRQGSTGLPTNIPSKNATFHQSAVWIGPFAFSVGRCNPTAFRDLENSSSREQERGVEESLR